MPAPQNHFDLRAIARDRLLQYGFLVEIPPEAQAEAARLAEPDFSKTAFRDFTGLLWSSIDNDTSRDLDQIEYLENDPGGVRLYVGVADVVSFVPRDSALDRVAGHNTTSLYLGVQTLPMFPDRMSTDLTSLLEGQKRMAGVVEMLISREGELTESKVYRAVVQNQAQLTYRGVAAWLDANSGEAAAVNSDSNSASQAGSVTARVLEKIRASQGLQEQLRLQHQLAELLRKRRAQAGALPFETEEIRPEPVNGGWDLAPSRANSATQLIEDFMIVANRAAVAFLEQKGFPAIRRIVRTPKDWPQLVQLAAQHGAVLASQPDSKALEDFLVRQQQKDPDGYADLSLAVIKLLGRGEYVVASPGEEAPGHFGLAVDAYAHTTAPNRRYPDVLTQRLLHAVLAGQPPPYALEVLKQLAQHCTQKEDDAKKAERSVHKSIVAAAMAGRIGETFEGMVTGASQKGVWVRINNPRIEGRLEGSTAACTVGSYVRVKLVRADPSRGYIDFRLIDCLPGRTRLQQAQPAHA